MNDDILKMAREAGLSHFYDSEGDVTGITDARLVDEDKHRNDERLVEILGPLIALVRADERERIKAANAPVIENINEHIKALEEAVAAEREACAKVCETHTVDDVLVGVGIAQSCAAAIRARSKE